MSAPTALPVEAAWLADVARDVPVTALEVVAVTALLVAAGAVVAVEAAAALTLLDVAGLATLLVALAALLVGAAALLVAAAVLLVVAADAELVVPLVTVAVPQAARPTAPSNPTAAVSNARRGCRPPWSEPRLVAGFSCSSTGSSFLNTVCS